MTGGERRGIPGREGESLRASTRTCVRNTPCVRASWVRHVLGVAAAVLGACSSAPPVPDWQIEARDALARMGEAWLSGQDRVAGAEFARARAALARTGEATLVARAELTRCAVQTAALDFSACTGFDALAADASAAERAYAAYLAGRASASEAAVLPEAHRASAGLGGGAQTASPLTPPLTPSSAPAPAPILAAIPDPLSRLVAAGVLFRRGLADPATLQLAVDTASAQGWRRPLLAWLGVQLRRAEAAGAQEDAQRLKRRMDLVAGVPAR